VVRGRRRKRTEGEGEGEHDDDGEEVASHWSVLIVSSVFEGVRLLDRHRAVLSAVSAHLQQQAQESSGDKQGDSSTVLLKVKTPQQWVAAMNTMMPPAEEV
jgi:acid stress-induced BolA-like protein IbaG/YrbA